VNWYYQVIMIFLAVNAFTWYGTDLVITTAPDDSIMYNNFSEANSPAQSVLGHFFNTDVGPSSDAWLEANQSKLNNTVTTESEEKHSNHQQRARSLPRSRRSHRLYRRIPQRTRRILRGNVRPANRLRNTHRNKRDIQHAMEHDVPSSPSRF